MHNQSIRVRGAQCNYSNEESCNLIGGTLYTGLVLNFRIIVMLTINSTCPDLLS